MVNVYPYNIYLKNITLVSLCFSFVFVWLSVLLTHHQLHKWPPGFQPVLVASTVGKEWYGQHHVIAVPVLCHQHANTMQSLCQHYGIKILPSSKCLSLRRSYRLHRLNSWGQKLCCLLFKLTFAQSETPSNEHHAPKPDLLSISAI